MIEWKSGKIRDLGRVVTGSTPPTKNPELFGGVSLFITPSDLDYDSWRIHKSERSISQAGCEKFRTRMIPAGSIMYTCIASIGKIGIAAGDVLTNQQINSIVPYDDVDGRFVYYLLRNETQRIQNLNAGCAVPIINKGDFENIDVSYPSLSTQKRIADILSAYDDLIENNRRRMEILEESARLIYRKMFGGKKANGTKMPLSELADVVMGQSPESSTYNEDGVGLPFHQGVAGFGDRYPINEKWCTAGTRFAEEGDVLFSVRAPVGRINVSREKIVIGRGLAAMRAKNGCQSWLLHTLKNHFSKEDMIGVGCIFASTTKKELFSVELFVPPEVEIEKFEQEVGPMDEQIRVLTDVNLKLAKARDMLLSKLMSGR